MANIQNKIRSFVVKLSPKRRVLTLDNAEELIQLSHDMYYNTPTFDKYSAQEYTILDSHARPWTFNGPVEINAHIWMYLTSPIKYDFAGELNKALKKGCSLKSKNKTQSLGDALIFIEGTK